MRPQSRFNVFVLRADVFCDPHTSHRRLFQLQKQNVPRFKDQCNHAVDLTTCLPRTTNVGYCMRLTQIRTKRSEHKPVSGALTSRLLRAITLHRLVLVCGIQQERLVLFPQQLGVYLKRRLGDLLEGTEGAERTQKSYFLSVILRAGDELRLHPDRL